MRPGRARRRTATFWSATTRCRTDEGARLGGLGDTIEIDLLNTREKAFPEIGLNPILHRHDPAAKMSLDVHPPFGLTRDIASNALVSQTGIVVTTVGAAGRWVLARIRARRLILPETLLGSEMAMAKIDPDGASVRRAADLPLRRAGDDRVPVDFTLDADRGGMLPSFALALRRTVDAAAELLPIVWPDRAAAPAGQPVRYLCSWHKERWSDGRDPTWRLQVLGQTRPTGNLAWTTFSKSPGFDNPDYRLADRGAPDVVQLIETGDTRYRPSLVRMSDYTDPMWLTFIGSFGRESLLPAEAFWLTRDGGKLVLHGPPGETLPILQSIDQHDDPRFQLLLVYRRLADTTRGDLRDDTGALVAAYVSDGPARFRGLQLNGAAASIELAGCSAYLCSVQRITSMSTDEHSAMSPLSFEDLVELIFRELVDDVDPESLMRLLPEYIGPIGLR